MPIKCTTSAAEIDGYLDRKAELLHWKHIEILKRVGREAVKEARENHRYKDRTGNLTSSIGYCIVDNGKVIEESSFDVAKGVWKDEKGRSHPYSGDAGSPEGREYLSRLVSEHPSGLVLIVVAGMEYAAYVEAKNLNVLDSAELLAENRLKELLGRMKK
jgi:hypothetical protein